MHFFCWKNAAGSPSCDASSEHSVDSEPSKDNLRLLLTATGPYELPTQTLDSAPPSDGHRKRKIDGGSGSPRAAALAYQQVTSPKLPEASHSAPFSIPHSLYHLMASSSSSSSSSCYAEDVPEQEGPIDLSCRKSSTSSLCLIRAEILSGILHRDNDPAPLDLTTKA